MNKLLLISMAIVLVICGGVANAYVDQNRLQEEGDYIGEPMKPGVPDGYPGGDLFPNHDPDYTIISLTNNQYGDNQPFPNGYKFMYPCFNSDGSKIAVAARNQISAVSQPYEVWIMDYDASTQIISNFQQITFTAGTGDVYDNGYTSWSKSDPDMLMYCERHNTTPNLIMAYDVGTTTHDTLYNPALDSNGYDVTNPSFFSTYSDQAIFGSGYNTGTDRILLFTELIHQYR